MASWSKKLKKAETEKSEKTRQEKGVVATADDVFNHINKKSKDQPGKFGQSDIAKEKRNARNEIRKTFAQKVF